MTRLSWAVVGIPAPQGSKRHVGGGRFVESSKNVGPWREAVRATVAANPRGTPLIGPVRLSVTFWLPRPRSHLGVDGRPKRSAPTHPAVRPDLDKLLRALLDGLVDGGAIGDDAQIVNIHAWKTFADDGPPGAEIHLHHEPPSTGERRE